jgi:hypothetical protein
MCMSVSVGSMVLQIRQLTSRCPSMLDRRYRGRDVHVCAAFASETRCGSIDKALQKRPPLNKSKHQYRALIHAMYHIVALVESSWWQCVVAHTKIGNRRVPNINLGNVVLRNQLEAICHLRYAMSCRVQMYCRQLNSGASLCTLAVPHTLSCVNGWLVLGLMVSKPMPKRLSGTLATASCSCCKKPWSVPVYVPCTPSCVRH